MAVVVVVDCVRVDTEQSTVYVVLLCSIPFPSQVSVCGPVQTAQAETCFFSSKSKVNVNTKQNVKHEAQ